jgi:hypothetical protein
MDFFARIAENLILEAIEAGLFDNLPGKGRPLQLEDDRHIPPELRLAYKILKNADCLPPELELRREIITLQDLVASMEDEAEKLRQMRRLNFLMMKMGLMRPVSPQLQEHDLYTPKILEKLETKNKSQKKSPSAAAGLKIPR